MAGVGADLALVAATLPFIMASLPLIGMDAFGLEVFLDILDGMLNMVKPLLKLFSSQLGKIVDLGNKPFTLKSKVVENHQNFRESHPG